MYVPAPAATPAAVSFLDLYGHSFFSWSAGPGTAITSSTLDQTGEMDNILAAALSLMPAQLRNHAAQASSLVIPHRGLCGYARVLSDLQRKRKTYPFVRSGGMYVGCWGINDIGNFSAGATVQARYKDGLRAFISRARAAATYLAGAGGVWTFGANFTANTTTTYVNVSSGNPIRATVVDSAGTSTATFTIPLGYKGEPIGFAIVGTTGATGVDITWGGTITGTSGILTTVTTTDSVGVGGNYGLITKRFTAATNGLSAHNAGQTITLKVTRVSASGEAIIDSAWIEAIKPDPVIICNTPRLACVKYTLAFGDVVTTSGSANITSAIAQFATASDASNAITETDAQGAFTAGKTISSVTNATTAVMSGTAAASKTLVEVTLARTLNGYASAANGYSNTNFTAATPASHAAADADVVSLNSWTASVVAEFDSMVQIADLDGAIGADLNLPAAVTTFFSLNDGLHPNDIGGPRCAQAMLTAVQNLAAADLLPLGQLEMTGIAIPVTGSVRRPRPSGTYATAEYGAWGSVYTCVAGDMFAFPIMITEFAETWNNFVIQQTNAPVTAGSNVRVGIYEDVALLGYPQSQMTEVTSGGAFAMGTTAGLKTISLGFGWTVKPGLNWLVFKVDSLGTTASQVNQINGPNPYLPSMISGGGTTAPIAYKLTGQSAGALPTVYPTGATLVGSTPALCALIV